MLNPLVKLLKWQTTPAAGSYLGFPLIFDITGRLGTSYGLYGDSGLPQLEACLEKYPELIFVGHGLAFWVEIGRLDSPEDRYGYPGYPVRKEGVVPKLMSKYPNLWAELSAGSGANAMKRDSTYAVQFINEFQDKLMFGTDICTYKQPAYIVDFLKSLLEEKKISEDVFWKVARENAIKLLEI